jgi:hypothetical protein
VGAERFLDYLDKYWFSSRLQIMNISLHARVILAKKMNCSTSEIPTTTNHLESLNHHLKDTVLEKYSTQGNLLRADILVVILVAFIIPLILRRRENQQMVHLEDKKRQAALLDIQQKQVSKHAGSLTKKALPSSYTSLLSPPSYYHHDSFRDNLAKIIFQKNSVLPQFNIPLNISMVTSLDFKILSQNPFKQTLYYLCYIECSGYWYCQCDDFGNVGGCCKHIRACFMYIDHLQETGFSVPIISKPFRPKIMSSNIGKSFSIS